MGSNKSKESFEVIDLATATEPRVRDNETEEIYTLTEAVCKLLNEIKEIRKSIG